VGEKPIKLGSEKHQQMTRVFKKEKNKKKTVVALVGRFCCFTCTPNAFITQSVEHKYL